VIDGYKIHSNGVIEQIDKTPSVKYGIDYSAKYDSYGDLADRMSYLRLGYIIGAGLKIDFILDVGFGNGAFLRTAAKSIKHRYGADFTDAYLPDTCNFVSDITSVSVDCVCFFDSLEHFEDPTVIENLKTDYVCISVPWCHNYTDWWFRDWKHRRPGEHFWHFNDVSLVNFFNEYGYSLITTSTVEDTIRKSPDGDANILTAIFRKVR
jgi:hypothetical protein